jgi:hypothetical protein
MAVRYLAVMSSMIAGYLVVIPCMPISIRPTAARPG